MRSILGGMRGFAWLVAGAAVAGCFPSPLLHHADAGEIAGKQKDEQHAAAGCMFNLPVHGLCATLTWVQQPSDDEEGEFQLRFWNPELATEAGPYVTPSNEVGVKLWMPSMGHGSSPVKVVPEVDASGAAVPGIFRATRVYFSMPGNWEIWVQLKKDKTILEQAKVNHHV